VSARQHLKSSAAGAPAAAEHIQAKPAPGAGMPFADGAAMAATGGSFAAGEAAHSVQMKEGPLVHIEPAAGAAIQFLGSPLDGPQAEGEETPAHGESRGQRRFSVEQYVEMWEKEQGRKITPAEQKTLNRGCIGITAMNLTGGGNPLSAAEKCYAKFDMAEQAMNEKNKLVDSGSLGSMFGKGRYVLYAKLFWSNQSDSYEDRFKPDEDAFLPDPETGEVDMSDYKYKAQSRMKTGEDGEDIRSSYINFDYGFWDENSQCFWHANHCQPGMKVYQSTKDKFAAGYIDFDRIIYCIAFAQNYDPALGASTHVGDG